MPTVGILKVQTATHNPTNKGNFYWRLGIFLSELCSLHLFSFIADTMLQIQFFALIRFVLGGEHISLGSGPVGPCGLGEELRVSCPTDGFRV